MRLSGNQPPGWSKMDSSRVYWEFERRSEYVYRQLAAANRMKSGQKAVAAVALAVFVHAVDSTARGDYSTEPG
jgi:hypothetical protein